MPNLLVEVGVEELPLASLDVIYAELGRKVSEQLESNRVTFGKVLVEATPRRIALFVENISERQRDQILEISGPSQDKAYDEQGNPTKALEGFLKSKKALLKDVQLKETPKGKFVVIQKKETGKALTLILPALLKEAFTSLSFPKQMRWESSAFRFPRPIRWIVTRLDKKVIPFQLAGVKSGKLTSGHRFLSGGKPVKIRVADWKIYQAVLKRAHVILSLEERKSMIREALNKRFDQKNHDEDLVHTTAQLVEEPSLIKGNFSKTYLDLPAEVLASCMKKNQKIFACYDSKNKLIPRFVAVMNGKRKGLGRVVFDYENVLESRLRDARFFYDADSKEALETKLPQLVQLVYLGKLGSVLQKTERLEKLAEIFTGLIGRHDARDDLKRAARLCKIDLVTQLVYEFPDLQGIAGREYALESGEKENVAQAIGMQYLPKNLAEDYQELKKQITPFGAMLGIIDRLDLLVGAFGIGLEPTGSQDPFALRRAGGVLVKLVRTFGFHFPIGEAIQASAVLFGSSLEIGAEDLKKRLINLFRERLARELQLEQGSRAMEIFQAVWKAAAGDAAALDIADIYDRFSILNGLYERDPEILMKAAKVVERTSNILKGIKGDIPPAVDPALFKEGLEYELFKIIENKSVEINQALERREYEKATILYGRGFYSTVHDFFEQVMVNAEDAQIRGNRQALMKRLHNLYADRLADLSVLSKIEIE